MTNFEDLSFESKYRGLLREHFPLYKDSDRIIIRNNDYLIIDYQTYDKPLGNIINWQAYREISYVLSLNFDWNADVMYLVFIHIPKQMRGKGYGKALCDVAEKTAFMLGSRYIEQTPSGTTGTGESRLSYLLRRGYQQFDNVVRKYL